MQNFKIALCQTIPSFDPSENLQDVTRKIEKASNEGAQLIAFPEMVIYPYILDKLAELASIAQNFLDEFRKSAQKYKCYICTGSLPIKVNEKLFNMSYIIGPDGSILHSYAKTHLYDVDFGKLHVQESQVFSPGERISICKTPLTSIGLQICYDIRFPEVSRSLALQGAELILVPAVFNQVTGPAHWHTMMRARAIENQVYLAAISQGLNRHSPYKAYGHSMVVSPWGDILTEADNQEMILMADISIDLLESTRNQLPLLKHRKLNVYFHEE